MCKSANERGGPYRCPGDMQKKVATALENLHAVAEKYHEAHVKAYQAQEAAVAANERYEAASLSMSRRGNEPDAPWRVDGVVRPAQEHIAALVDAGDLPVDALDMPPRDAFKHYNAGRGLEPDDPGAAEHHYDSDAEYLRRFGALRAALVARDQARDVFRKAHDEYTSAGLAKKAARLELDAAKADYHSTARGLGELQRDHDAERDVLASARLNHMVEDARERANLEAHRRYEGALERGEDPTQYAYRLEPLRTEDRDGDGSGTAWLARRDRISGSARVYDQAVNKSMTSVTLTATDRDGQVHEASFGVPPDSPPPSVSTLLGALAQTKDSVDRADGSAERWRISQGFGDSAHEREHAAFAYKAAQANAARFTRLLGERRAAEYVEVHTGRQAPRMVAV